MELKLLCYFKPDTIDHRPAAAGRRTARSRAGIEGPQSVTITEKAPMSTLGIGTLVRKDHKGQAVR